MAPDDVAILMAALKSHEERAEKKWDLVFKRMDKNDERWFKFLPLLTETKEHLKKSERLDEINNKERINFFWKILWIPVSAITTLIGWIIFESWKKGLK